MRDTRARLTLTDVVMIVAALFVLAALGPPVYTALNTNAAIMSQGEAYLWQAIFPLMVVVLLGVIFLKAVVGVGQ